MNEEEEGAKLSIVAQQVIRSVQVSPDTHIRRGMRGFTTTHVAAGEVRFGGLRLRLFRGILIGAIIFEPGGMSTWEGRVLGKGMSRIDVTRWSWYCCAQQKKRVHLPARRGPLP